MNRKKGIRAQPSKSKLANVRVGRSNGALKPDSSSARGNQCPSPQTDEGKSSPWETYLLILLVCLCTLLIVLTFFNPHVQMQLAAKSTSEAGVFVREPSSEEREESGILDDFTHTGIVCDKLMDDAKSILDTRPPSEWEGALDLLATCALQEPQNAAPRWNLAVALLKMGRDKEAVSFIDEALSLDPSNVDYLKTGSAILSKHGHHTEVVKCLEYYLEVSLRVPSWEELLASISILREDEWEFIYEAGEDIIQVLEMLQAAYLKSSSLIKAGYLYRVLIGLKGDKAELELIAAYSSFAFGLGDIATGIEYLRSYTEKQYVLQGYGDRAQAYEVVTAHSLRLFTAGFDSTLNCIVKNLLSGGDPVWEELVYNCELQESNTLNYTVQVRQSDLQRIFIKCVLAQNVINRLISDGAVLYAENIFGWSPLLHAASLGSRKIIKQLLATETDPQSRTVLAQTALHVAAIRGSYDIVEPVLNAGLTISDEDYFNRTALQVACLHRWSAVGMARALQQELPHGCPNKLLYSPPPKLHMQGGWLGSGISLPQSLTRERCNIDVMAEPDVLAFVFDYLALQRPVLIRNATNNHQMKSLFHTWQRNKFELEYGGLTFQEVEVPYAEAFGYKTSKPTTIKIFMAKMKKLNQEQKQTAKIDQFTNPTYIFETISSTSPILKDFSLPSVLDPELTNIESSKIQFYLGPPLSGAPVHFHRNAWNILMYGQKHWFLYPPDRAFYSKQHVWDWWKDKEGGQEDDPPLECIQYPGDLMFVPDMWGHAVINIKESVGLASEFIYGASEFSI